MRACCRDARFELGRAPYDEDERRATSWGLGAVIIIIITWVVVGRRELSSKRHGHAGGRSTLGWRG
jgi:hypothetical protein